MLTGAGDVDGDSLSATLAQDAEHGHVALDTDGSFTYTPDANFNGTDQFTYQVSDGHGGVQTATATITVAGTNDGPTAADSSYAGTEDNPVQADASHGVLTNASDIDGDTLSATLAQDAQYGHVELNSDGSFTYTPNADFSGTDQFTYQVSDGHGGVQSATATITVAAAEGGHNVDVTPPTDPGNHDPVTPTPPTDPKTEPTDSTPTQPSVPSENTGSTEPETPQNPGTTDPSGGVTGPVDDKTDEPVSPQDPVVTDPVTPPDTSESGSNTGTTVTEPTTTSESKTSDSTSSHDVAKTDSLDSARFENQVMLDAARRAGFEQSTPIATPEVTVAGREVAAAVSSLPMDSVPTVSFATMPQHADEVPKEIHSASESQPDNVPEPTKHQVDVPVVEASDVARPTTATPSQQVVGAAAAVGLIADASYLSVSEVDGDRRTFMGRDRDGSDSRRRSTGSAAFDSVFGVREVDGTRSAFASSPLKAEPVDSGNAATEPASDNAPEPASEPSLLRAIWRKLTHWR